MLCLLLAVPHAGRGQDSTQVDPGRAAVVGATVLSAVVAVHIYQRDAWWQGEWQPFRFENDWQYALNIDKFGHTFGAYTESKLARSVLSWTGFSRSASLFYGSLIGLSYQMYVEVEDGYHKTYGFSPGDAFSNIIGASLPLAQESIPLLSHFSMKYSYWPSSNYLNALQTNQFRTFIDDYEGTIFWITCDPHFLLPRGLAEDLPPWVGISLGLAVHHLNENGGGDRLYYLTADYNFSKIPTESGFLRALFGALDFFHLPAPGIGIEDGRLHVGVYYTYHAKLSL